MFGKKKSDEERRIERVRKSMLKGAPHECEFWGDYPRSCMFCSRKEEDEGYDP